MAQDSIAILLKQREDESKQLSLFDTTVDAYKKPVKRKVGRPKRKRIEDIIPPEQVTLNMIEEKDRIVEGVHEVGGKLYDDLGYNKVLKSKRAAKILKDIVLSRLTYPVSKHKLQKILTNDFDKKHDLDAIYRTMDKVYEQIPTIKKITFDKTKNLFPEAKTDIILFDVTTLYFESVETDELREFGYSKDQRFNTVQVVLALATNADGLPIGYELFEGNKAEVKTLLGAIDSWKKLFDIGNVCFIGDRAMFCQDNIKLINNYGYQYIVAAKLRSMSNNLKEQILDEKNYNPDVLGNQLAWIGEFEYQGQRLISSYKSSRARKDFKNREVILSKVNKQLGKTGKTTKVLTNQGIKKYTTTSEDALTKIDAEKVDRDSQWDGMHGIITNIKDEKATTLIAKYCRLWVIEESFRVNKHTLKMRPIYHFKPERIKAHIAMCYMGFTVLRHLQYRVALQQKVSTDDILDELLRVQSSIHIHKVTKDLYRLPGKFTQTARKIYKAIGVERSLDAAIYPP